MTYAPCHVSEVFSLGFSYRFLTVAVDFVVTHLYAAREKLVFSWVAHPVIYEPICVTLMQGRHGQGTALLLVLTYSSLNLITGAFHDMLSTAHDYIANCY